MSSKVASGGRRGRGLGAAAGPARTIRLFDVSRYGGKVVATCAGEVVAVGDSFTEVDEEIRRQGRENEVILTRVPDREDIVL